MRINGGFQVSKIKQLGDRIFEKILAERGMQLDGKRFFYVNPLETEPGVSGVRYGYEYDLPVRQNWYPCACCPPNIARLLTSLGKYLWSHTQ